MSEYLFDNQTEPLVFAGDSAPTPTPATPVTTRKGNKNMTIPRIELGKMYHLKWPRWKHEENSVVGMDYAAAHGYDSIDLDMQIDAQGVVWNTHWLRPMERDHFIDPEGKMPKGKRIDRMTTAEVQRLIARDNGHTFHMVPMAHRFKQATERGLKIAAEAKQNMDNNPHWTRAVFAQLRAESNAAHAKVVVSTLDSHAGWRELLNRARAEGFDTRRIHTP